MTSARLKPVLDGTGAVYQQIRRAVARPILRGDWAPGSRIPSEHELTELFGASRMTVNKALSALADEGLIVRRRRLGSFVAERPPERAVMEIWDIGAEILRTGQNYTYRKNMSRLFAADADAVTLVGVPPQTPLLEISGLHSADGVPIQLERRLINIESAPAAETTDFSETPPGRWLLDHIAWTDAEHLIRAIEADREIAELLEIEEGTACLRVERRTWNEGVLVTWAELISPGGARQLVGRFTRPGA